jgi:hypothetical protein
VDVSASVLDYIVSKQVSSTFAIKSTTYPILDVSNCELDDLAVRSI